MGQPKDFDGPWQVAEPVHSGFRAGERSVEALSELRKRKDGPVPHLASAGEQAEWVVECCSMIDLRLRFVRRLGGCSSKNAKGCIKLLTDRFAGSKGLFTLVILVAALLSSSSSGRGQDPSNLKPTQVSSEHLSHQRTDGVGLHESCRQAASLPPRLSEHQRRIIRWLLEDQPPVEGQTAQADGSAALPIIEHLPETDGSGWPNFERKLVVPGLTRPAWPSRQIPQRLFRRWRPAPRPTRLATGNQVARAQANQPRRAKQLRVMARVVQRRTVAQPNLLTRWKPAGQIRIPAEFEPQEALLLGCRELADYHPELFAQLVAHIASRAAILALVPDLQCQRAVAGALKAYGVSDCRVTFVEVQHDTMWTRDYGPFVGQYSDGSVALVDAHYAELERPQDDQVPEQIGGFLRLPVVEAPLSVEGGNLLTNGTGLFLTTSRLLERNAARGYDKKEVRRILRRYYGAKQVVFLEPLAGEETGHVDMFATMTSPTTVVIGRYDQQEDPVNAAILDRNAARLATLKAADGQPLNVVRIPMPPHADGQWRTYTNAIYVNRLLLVPSYPTVDPEGLTEALDTYQHLLPDWQVVTLDATSVIQSGGALHCVSMNLSRLRATDDGQRPRQVPARQMTRTWTRPADRWPRRARLRWQLLRPQVGSGSVLPQPSRFKHSS